MEYFSQSKAEVWTNILALLLKGTTFLKDQQSSLILNFVKTTFILLATCAVEQRCVCQSYENVSEKQDKIASLQSQTTSVARIEKNKKKLGPPISEFIKARFLCMQYKIADQPIRHSAINVEETFLIKCVILYHISYQYTINVLQVLFLHTSTFLYRRK